MVSKLLQQEITTASWSDKTFDNMRNKKGQFVKGHSFGVRFGSGQSFGDKSKYKKISLAQKGKKRNWKHFSPPPIHLGADNPMWKGGVTSENEKLRKSLEYKLWRTAVFMRDNFTCQMCNKKESVSGKLEADHIKPWSLYPELRFAIDNGRTLCKECHKKTDTYLNKIRWVGQNL